MLKTYLFLVGAIICEVCGTMLLPVTQNFTKVTPTVFLAGFYLSAFYLLTFVVDKLPIAIVYGTWSGLGIFTIAILGYIFFKQSLSWQACQLKDCLKKIYPNIAIVKIPSPLQVP